MDSARENERERDLLGLRSLEPLDAKCVAGIDGLVEMIEGHNTRRARGIARVRDLTANRARLEDYAVWENANGADLATQRALVRGEEWDALLELHRTLTERATILEQMEARLRAVWRQLNDEHDRVVAQAERRLAGERRALRQACPRTAEIHFAELVSEDTAVAEASARLGDTRAAIEFVKDAHRHLLVDSRTLAARRREAFKELVG